MKTKEKKPSMIWTKEDWAWINTTTKGIILGHAQYRIDSLLNNLGNLHKALPDRPTVCEFMLQGFEREAKDILNECAERSPKIRKGSDNDSLIEIMKKDNEYHRWLAKTDSAWRIIAAAMNIREAIALGDGERTAIETMRLVFAAVTMNVYEEIMRGLRLQPKLAPARGGRAQKKRQWVIEVIIRIIEKAKNKTFSGIKGYLEINHEKKRNPLLLSGGGKAWLILTAKGDNFLCYKGPNGKDRINLETARTEYFPEIRKIKKIGK